MTLTAPNKVVGVPVETGSQTTDFQFHGSLVLILVLTLIAYAQVASFQFVNWDDSVYIVNRPEIHNGLTLTGICWAFTTFQNSNWHPLTWMSHMLDIQLFGIDSGMMHLMNLAIHCGNVVLVALVVRGLTARPVFGLLIAAFFAVHPQHVEVVAWISERKELLSGFWGLLTMLMWQKFEVSRRGRDWWLAHGLYVLALLSKQMLVTLPFLLIVLAVCPLKPGENKIAWRQFYKVAAFQWLFFVLSLGFSICIFIAQRSGGSVVSVEVLPMWMRCGNAIRSLFLYLAQSFVPIGLSPFYRYQDIRLSLGSFSLMGWLAGCDIDLGLAKPFRHVYWLDGCGFWEPLFQY